MKLSGTIPHLKASVWTSSKSTPPCQSGRCQNDVEDEISPMGELEGDNKVTNTPIMELIRSQFVSLEEAAMQMQACVSDSRRP